MIQVVYSRPCVYDPLQRGMADINLAYTGECPLKTAQRFIKAHWGYKLYSVVKDGVVYFQG